MNRNKKTDSGNQSVWQKLYTAFKNSVIYKIGQFIVSSAAVSLLITLIIFAVEQKEDAERTDAMIYNLESISGDLLDVQNAVSTRYLGIFPDYLTEVNSLLEKRNPADTIVIFEDVLYYGILSKPESFIRMNHMLLTHMEEGGHVTIAYYDIEGETFHRMLREQRISPEFFSQMDAELETALGTAAAKDDAKVCEKYFRMTVEKDFAAFAKNVDKYLLPLGGKEMFDDPLGRELEEMYQRMDDVKTKWLGKEKSDIGFSDYENMYKGLSQELISVYESHGVELIPLDEYLTMTCWLVSGQAVLAFPSKYATEEIGFYSKDPAFSEYIRTMLQGVRGYYRN